ncbi:hypothetical protein [Streptomyces sp. NBC_01264]|uniref:hypothetical protein n=1 Tax=Streptomyces sp. NBC_01264 TaxID=2903804 RepID=UPI002254EE84|nr:hypothetical protein [Streptomyces sp. NBC_01264]MCX4779976.1 hypothetical protein [Streptomyces sp. NBC_01264]
MTPGRCCRAVRAAMFAATCVLLSSLGHILMSGTSVPWWGMTAAFAGTSAAGWILAGRERGLAAVVSATVGVQAALHGGFSLAQAAAARPREPDGALASLTSPTSPTSLTSLGRRWAQYLLCDAPSMLGPQAAPPPGAGAAARHVMQADVHGMASMTGMAGSSGMHGMHGVHGSHAMADGSASLAAALSVPSAHAMGSMSPAGMLAGHLLAALVCGLWLAHGERGAFRVLRAVAARFLVPLRLFFRLPAPAHRPRVRRPRDHRVRTPRRLLLADALTSRGPPHGIAVV